MSAEKDKPWKRLDYIQRKALKHVQYRKLGLIKSVKTPWAKLNEATAGGFEWNSIITIAGRSGSGKTTILNEFTRKVFKNNPQEEICVLDFQFEMTHEATGIREFTQVTGHSYKELLSAERPLDDVSINKISTFVNNQAVRDIYQVDSAQTVQGIKHLVEEFFKEHPNKRVIVTIDHSYLIRSAASEKDKFETLYNLGEMMTELKKKLNIMWIVLTQMNRSIESDVRTVPGTTGNYPTSSDVFGADALLQHSDILMIISVPSLLNIPVYGPKKIPVTPDLLILHLLKVRNGEPCMIFFEKRFEQSHMVEKKIQLDGSVSPSGAPRAIPTPGQLTS